MEKDWRTKINWNHRRNDALLSVSDDSIIKHYKHSQHHLDVSRWLECGTWVMSERWVMEYTYPQRNEHTRHSTAERQSYTWHAYRCATDVCVALYANSHHVYSRGKDESRVHKEQYNLYARLRRGIEQLLILVEFLRRLEIGLYRRADSEAIGRLCLPKNVPNSTCVDLRTWLPSSEHGNEL